MFMNILLPFRLGDVVLEQLSLFLASGMHIQSALKGVEDETTNKRAQAIIAAIRRDIEQGIPCSKALEKAGLFSPGAIAMIAIGERTGTLSESVTLIAQMQGNQRLLRSKIQNAALYPILVFGVALVVGGGITIIILPRLATIFSQLCVELPPITKFLIAIGSVVGSIRIDAMITIGGMVALGVVMLTCIRSVRSSAIEYIFHIPGLHRMMKETEVGRFGYLFGTMLEAGVPALQALQSIGDSAPLPSYRRLYLFMAARLEEGVSLAQSLSQFPRSTTLIPRAVQGMIAAGEQSGLLQSTVQKIGGVYEAKGEATAKNLTTILEPLLLIVVWLAVLLIAMAVIIPIYSLIGELQTR